ncbi:MAG: GNAT family N-acetyltransferase [Candidatus Thorarchaeota archaeon]
MLQPIVRPPKLEEQSVFFSVYGTGIPNVDPLTYDGFTRWWNRSRIQGDLPSLWRVAAIDEQIVGIAINAVLDGLGWGAIWELAVSPDWRSKGIGSKLVQSSEEALLERNTNLTHFVMGVKAHNYRALPFVERMGYGIQGLVLRLDGVYNDKITECALETKIPRLEQIPFLQHLIPDTYWGLNSQTTLEYAIRGGNCYTLTVPDSNMIVGFVRFEVDREIPDSTVITFSYRLGYGRDVINTALCEMSTKNAVFWVQDKHEEIIDHLYSQGFHRVEAEFLARKRVKT